MYTGTPATDGDPTTGLEKRLIPGFPPGVHSHALAPVDLLNAITLPLRAAMRATGPGLSPRIGIAHCDVNVSFTEGVASVRFRARRSTRIGVVSASTPEHTTHPKTAIAAVKCAMRSERIKRLASRSVHVDATDLRTLPRLWQVVETSGAGEMKDRVLALCDRETAAR